MFFVFHYGGKLIVLSRTPRRDFSTPDLVFDSVLNLARLRLHLKHLGCEVSYDTRLRKLTRVVNDYIGRQKFGIDASVEDLMGEFHLPYVKKRGDYWWKDPVLVKIVFPDGSRSDSMSISQAERLTFVQKLTVRDYVRRRVLFDYQGQRCYFVYARN